MISTKKYPGLRTFNILPFKDTSLLYFNHLLVKKQIIKIARRERPDVIHSNDRFTIPGAILAGRELGIPTVAQIRDYWFMCPKTTCFTSTQKRCNGCSVRKILKDCFDAKFLLYLQRLSYLKLTSRILKNADALIALSSAVKNKLSSINVNRNVFVIPPGRKMFSIKKPKQEIKKKYGIKGKVILFSGKLNVQKGGTLLLDLIRNFLPKYEGLTLLIAGKGPLKKELIYASRQSSNHKGTLTVILPWQPHDSVISLINEADIVLYPSLWEEPFGSGIVEAMLAEKPVIASNLGGITDIIDDGKTGFLFEPEEIETLYQKLELLVNNEELRMKIGERAKKYAVENFDIRKIAERVYKLYEELLRT